MSSTNLLNCPKCNSSQVKKVNWTWWGGMLGPSLLNHTKCESCQSTYNGKTGESNSKNISIYFIVSFIIVILILYAIQ